MELARKPVQCLEYIIVHEMVHLREPDHNDRFRDLMNRFMPQWRSLRDELNQAPLGHETWSY
ncbi:MAG: M48 family metallopeptidase [Methanoregula sp.]|nr:M48 family metallopeptidase [Methanoregula sp.]